MQTIIIKELEEGIKPPMSNGFDVTVSSEESYSNCIYEIQTGISLAIPNGLSLRLDSAGEFIILGWSNHGGPLRVVVLSKNVPQCGDKIAKAWIVPEDTIPIRFMQRDPSGGRIIRGEAQNANSIENRKSES